MPDRTTVLTKRTLDKDLDKLTHVEDATKFVSRKLVAPGPRPDLPRPGRCFLRACTCFDRPGAVLVIAAAALAAYMAMNIGANDVTNNVGAAVGARAMTMGQALVIAAIFEILGATIAGGEVVKTISSSIVDAVQVAAGDAQLDHDGGADGGRLVDQPRHLAECAGFDHAFDRRRGDRRRRRARSAPSRSTGGSWSRSRRAGSTSPLIGGVIAAGLPLSGQGPSSSTARTRSPPPGDGCPC